MAGNLFEGPARPNHPQDEPSDEPVKLGPRRGTQEWARAKLAEIYKLVDVAGPNTFSTIRFRERLRQEVRDMVWDQVGVLTIEKHVKNRIHDFCEGSIR